MTRSIDSRSNGDETLQTRQSVVLVWDLFIRIFHWTVVTGFFIAYFTEDDMLTLHVWAGYVVGVFVILRVLWGFVGPRHARFSDFVYRPSTVWRYAIDLILFRAKRYLGHSPAGGAMVLFLLVGLLATIWSGLEVYAVEENAGPLAANSREHWVANPPSDGQVLFVSEREHKDEQHEKGNGGGLWEEIHEAVANVLLFFVIIHLSGVILGSIVHRENLVRSMITGQKRNE